MQHLDVFTPGNNADGQPALEHEVVPQCGAHLRQHMVLGSRPQ
jgi:hypothetical protein